MPCLLLILVLAFPRIMLLFLYFFTNFMAKANHGLLLTVLGFFFLPLTTVTHAALVNWGRPMEGVNLLILIVAVIIDVGGIGGGARRGRR